MYHKLLKVFLFALLILSCQPDPAETETAALPYLKKENHITRLMVDDKPFLILGGELGNSSASNLDTLQRIWPKLEYMNLNTVLVPVYWEQLEPSEGKFDFRLVDGIIRDARKHKMKIVILWFGSWKNSMSCYAPLWVKKDQDRFPRARKRNGEAIEILSPFYPENLEADKKAFVQLMRHLANIDSRERTVIMVQVENEIGMIPEARDFSEAADRAFTSEVPEELTSYLTAHMDSLIPEFKSVWEKNGFRKEGNWEALFGKGLHTEEIFMAWHFARYTGEIAAAGREVYPIPMYVNAALIRPGYTPGRYPSAGPLPHLMDIWRAAAPSIDFLAPDIYFPNFAEWAAKYDRSGNPLFIPEVGNNQSVANAFYAFAEHKALGYSPFSIESLENPGDNEVTRSYDLLHQLSELILEKQGTDELAGILLDSIHQQTQIQMGDYVFTAKHEYSWPYASRSENGIPRYGGLIIRLAESEFIIAGTGLIVTFGSAKGGAKAGIGSLDEVEFRSGEWMYGRRMNGDQNHQGRHMQLPGNGIYSMQKVKLYTYE